jgi:hypothetical protein
MRWSGSNGRTRTLGVVPGLRCSNRRAALVVTRERGPTELLVRKGRHLACAGMSLWAGTWQRAPDRTYLSQASSTPESGAHSASFRTRLSASWPRGN